MPERARRVGRMAGRPARHEGRAARAQARRQTEAHGDGARQRYRVSALAAGRTRRRHPSPDRGHRRTAVRSATGRAAHAHRMLRHQHAARHEHRRIHGGLCQRRAGQTGSTSASRSAARAARASQTISPAMREVLRRRFRRLVEPAADADDPGQKARSRRRNLAGSARPGDRRRRQGATGHCGRGTCRN